MNLLNKSLLSALAVAMVLGLAACGKKEEGTTGTTGTGTTEQPATGTGTTGTTGTTTN